MKSVLRTALVLFLLACLPGLFFAPYSTLNHVYSQSLTAIRPLAAGDSITREISGQTSHFYEIKLTAGQRLRAQVSKEDLQLAAEFSTVSGQKLYEFTSRREGPLELSLIAEVSGSYHLAIRSLEKAETTRGYALRVEMMRDATARDRTDNQAMEAFAEAERLLTEWKKRSLQEGLKKYEEARRLWQSNGQQREAADSLRALGELYFTLSRYPQALDAFRKALTTSSRARDRRGEIQALNRIGYLYSNQGDAQHALKYCQRVLNHYRAQPELLSQSAADQREEAQAINTRGEIYYAGGELKKALEHFVLALNLWSKAGSRKGQALAHLNLGYAYSDSGSLPQSLEHFQQALALSRAIEDEQGGALALTAIGSIRSFLGERQSALESHRQALQIFRTYGDRQGEAIALNSIGQIYEDLNELPSALDHYRLALDINRENGNGDFEALTLYYVGRVQRSMGNTTEALDHYQQCLRLSHLLGKRRVEAYAITDIGAIYGSLGKKQFALANYQKALKVYRDAGDRRGQSIIMRNIGDIYLSSGKTQTALSYYEPALSFSRAAGDRSVEAATLYDIARAERALGRLDEALRHITDSIKLIESLRIQIASPALRASYFASVHKHYELYILLLMEMERRDPGKGYASTALEASESARARALLETLMEAKVDFRQGADHDLLERERRLQQSLNAKAIYQMRLLSDDRTQDEREEIEREIRQLTNEYQEVQSLIRIRSPRYASLVQPQPLRLQDIQAELNDDNTLLLEFELGDEKSYLWAVTAHTIDSFELPERATIEKAAREVYQLLTARQINKDESFTDYQEQVLEADSQYWRKTTALSQMLLGQVAAQLGDQRLLIVADGALQYLPFEALPIPVASASGPQQSALEAEASADNVTPIVLKHETLMLPSASTLAILRQEQGLSRPASKSVIVLADPVFDEQDPRIKLAIQTSAEKAAATEGEPGRQDPVGVSGGHRMPRLLATAQEAEAILSLIPPQQGAKLMDFDASRETAMSDRLSDYNIVHFATHGIINSEHPELSGIILSMVNARGEQQNGFLQLHDIYNLKLSANLVVLSACSTGLGKEVKGEGLVGLTRGFMYAGTRSVVASLWKVDDTASMELMKHFYRLMLQDGLPPAAALKEAKVALWRQKRWQSPYYWAAFVLQGEYRNRIEPGGGARRGMIFLKALAVIIILSTVCFVAFKVGRRHVFKR
jgi:CHAT domain-containing protein/tetratricopeptide (TPR) repeat protein